MIKWHIVDSGALPAQDNMNLDADLLAEQASKPSHILRFYEWQAPSITFGHFIDPHQHLNLDEASTLGIEVARRPTGGGVISHFSDFTFSLLVPKDSPYYTTDTLTNYCFVNEYIKKSLQTLSNINLTLLQQQDNGPVALDHFCMAKPTVLDVMCGPLKVSGGAQRRTKHGFLHQGTISLSPPNWEWLYKVIRSQEVVDQMKARSHYILHVSRDDVKKALTLKLPTQIS